MKETSVQSRVIDVYTSNGWLVVKILQCTLNGWPDLQAHKDGVTIFIECKRPGERPTPLQLYRHKQLRGAGFEVLVIDYLL